MQMAVAGKDFSEPKGAPVCPTSLESLQQDEVQKCTIGYQKNMQTATTSTMTDDADVTTTVTTTVLTPASETAGPTRVRAPLFRICIAFSIPV